MFYLSLIEHTLRLPPSRFGLPLQEGIKKELEHLFIDKVIAKLGLCISVYDIRKIEGGFIFPGDGASTYTVQFRLVVFRPFVGEVISAKLKASDTDGLQLTLGFFDDIYIPAHFLPMPNHYELGHDPKYKVTWFWEYNDDRFPIDEVDEIKFRVETVSYPPVPVEQLEQSKPFAPMVITGTIDLDGLGPVSWWREN
ncbi:uncharacterized protein [Rutidosis leptorrhynchoides]|uniref:uncharacterized protein n=1 Tax=Rutidosis leptorrhynchoides TaxID=125765 RepID=UPI003A98CEA6